MATHLCRLASGSASGRMLQNRWRNGSGNQESTPSVRWAPTVWCLCCDALALVLLSKSVLATGTEQQYWLNANCGLLWGMLVALSARGNKCSRCQEEVGVSTGYCCSLLLTKRPPMQVVLVRSAEECQACERILCGLTRTSSKAQ